MSLRGTAKAARALSPGAHTKHLGPSNLASHPTQTRNTKIKIKPGKGMDAEVLEVTAPLRQEGGGTDESTPLLGAVS